MATIIGFLNMGAHWRWRHLKNITKPSMCGGDAALCQITLTTSLSFVTTGWCTDWLLINFTS